MPNVILKTRLINDFHLRYLYLWYESAPTPDNSALTNTTLPSPFSTVEKLTLADRFANISRSPAEMHKPPHPHWPERPWSLPAFFYVFLAYSLLRLLSGLAVRSWFTNNKIRLKQPPNFSVDSSNNPHYNTNVK